MSDNVLYITAGNLLVEMVTRKSKRQVLINEVDVYKRVGKNNRLIPQISSNELIVNWGNTVYNALSMLYNTNQ